MKVPKLAEIRESKGLTQEELAQMANLTRGSIGNWESNGGIKKENAERLASVLQVNVAELQGISLNDDNESAANEELKSSIRGKTHTLFTEIPQEDAELYIPYYDVEITAGQIELYFDDVDEEPEGYIYAPQYRNCIACNVKGDSMYDRIFPGSRLYVYHLKNRKYIDFGQIYLVVLDGYRLLKYIDPDPEDNSKVILRSYNQHYKPWQVEKMDILHLFLVKGYENQNAM